MRILMYHEITPGQPEDIHAVSQAAFSAQMDWLRQAGYETVTLSDWPVAAHGQKTQSRGKPVVITFDDGYRDNYTTAWPILAEHGFTGTIFLVTGRMGQTSSWRPGALSRAPLLTWPEVRELSRSGMRFGSHTVSHLDLNHAPSALIEEELCASRDSLQQALGEPVDGLAYPYSRLNSQIKSIARHTGYRTACSCPTGYVGAANRDPYDLRRITVLATDQMSDFIAKLQGQWRLRLGWYRRVFGLWRRQLLGQRG